MMPIIDQKNPRILVLATNLLPLPGRIAMALSAVGFQVALICPAASPVHRIRKLGPCFVFRSWAPFLSIKKAIRAWSPTLLVCTDDIAIRALHLLHWSLTEAGGSDSGELIELIERSIGSEQTFETMEAKSRLIPLAQSLEVACPKTIVVTNHGTLRRELGKIAFPVLVKADGTWGGRGVRRVNSPEELRLAIPVLLFPVSWPGTIRRLLGKVLPFSMLGWMRKWPRIMSIQEIIAGRPCNRATVCWQGKVLAGINVEALKTSDEFGPATVVKIIDHPDMARAAERIAAKLNLSGFIGFDFVLDHANKAWLIEMNPRVTPISHIMNGYLPAALFTQMTGTEPPTKIPLVTKQTIALFPGELQRSNDSVYIASCYHDLPSDEPEFVQACLKPGLKDSLRILLGMGKMADRN
jgi:hypothetical protein